MRKLAAAEQANKQYDGYFSANVDALFRVLPDPVPAKDICITLGSSWVPPDIIDDFIEHLFGRGQYRQHQRNASDGRFSPTVSTKHDALSGTWEIPEKNRYGRSHVPKEVKGLSISSTENSKGSLDFSMRR